MSDLLPLFPLPNVVLFPNVFLPLHIFEPRYRDMVRDALAGDRMIGMVLRGIERFKILSEDHALSYRRAAVERLGERTLGPADFASIRSQRSKLEALLAPAVEKATGESRIPSAMSDEDLVNALAQYLDLEPLEKQALLEHHCLRSRAESLVELLEMRVLAARTPGFSPVSH